MREAGCTGGSELTYSICCTYVRFSEHTGLADRKLGLPVLTRTGSGLTRFTLGGYQVFLALGGSMEDGSLLDQYRRITRRWPLRSRHHVDAKIVVRGADRAVAYLMRVNATDRVSS